MPLNVGCVSAEICSNNFESPLYALCPVDPHTSVGVCPDIAANSNGQCFAGGERMHHPIPDYQPKTFLVAALMPGVASVICCFRFAWADQSCMHAMGCTAS